MILRPDFSCSAGSECWGRRRLGAAAPPIVPQLNRALRASLAGVCEARVARSGSSSCSSSGSSSSSSSMSFSGISSSFCTRRRRRTCNAVSTATSSMDQGPPGVYSWSEDDQSLERSARRKEHLSALIELKRLYRNSLRAKYFVDEMGSVYTPVVFPPVQELAPALDENGEECAPEQDSVLQELQVEERERQQKAVETVAEMMLTCDQLKTSLRSLTKRMGVVMNEEERDRTQQISGTLLTTLKARVQKEIAHLSFANEDLVTAAAEDRNLKYYNRRLQGQTSGSTSSLLSGGNKAMDSSIPMGGSTSSSMDMSAQPTTALERLSQAERIAEKFLVQRIKPALRRARETEFTDLIKNSTTYLQGLWKRLNGGSDRVEKSMQDLGLPTPSSTLKDSEMVIGMLSRQLESLEKKLQGASKARETKLRKAGLQGRVQMALQLKMIDADVLTLSRALAVLTMQLEMEYIYTSLEAEALDVFSGYNGRAPLPRDGSVTELELLAAEYFLIEEALLVLVSALDAKSPLTGSMVADDILQRLAVEIPDMRNRVGINDQIVFGGPGVTMTKLQLQKDEAIGKLKEAINFMVLGVRILASDVNNASKIFMRAALGGTLKQREVAALRRTAKDVVLFFPFAIILIIPLTPLGHVLIFGFIQTYFPSLFPSCFTSQRQDIMTKYEELRRALTEAQMKAEVAEDEAELARAAASAVALITNPPTPTNLPTLSSGELSAADENGPFAWFNSVKGGIIPGWESKVGKPSGVSAQYLAALANSGSENKSADAQDKVRVLEERVRQLGDRFRLGGKEGDMDGEVGPTIDVNPDTTTSSSKKEDSNNSH